MPSSINVNSEFRSRRDEMRGAADRVLPHRQSYLGFALGLIATVIVAMSGLLWWLMHIGVVYIQINM